MNETSFDQSIILSIKTLNLRGNGIENFVLTRNSLFSVEIQKLDLSHNSLIILENSGWLQSCKLKHLYLSHNKLLQVDVAFFLYLDCLDLSYNEFYQFSTEFYNTITPTENEQLKSNLTRLDLSHNQLLNLPFLHLENVEFNNIYDLNISDNSLSVILNNEFSTMINLKRLSLRSNKLASVETNAFKNLQKLVILDLRSNYLTGLGDSLKDPGKSLIKLLLGHNLFQVLPRQALKWCAKVKFLNLYDNRIRNLEDFSFGFMKSLIEVYLGGNLKS